MNTDLIGRGLLGGEVESEEYSDAELLPAKLLLGREIDQLTERADALGLTLVGLRLNEAAELCRREAPEPGTR